MGKRKILCINSPFGVLHYDGYEQDEFNTSVSFFDYDVVLIDSDYIVDEYEIEEKLYQNRKVLTENSSFALREQCGFFRKQITDYLQAGKNVFVLIGMNENCIVYTGESKYDGDGKNARKVRIVNEFDMYSFLPFKIEVSHLCGSDIQPCCHAPFADFFKKNCDILEYNGILSTKEKIVQLARVNGADKVVAAAVPYKRGNVVLLPHPWDEGAYDNEKEWREHSISFLNSILELDQNLSVDANQLAFPQWAQKYSILNEAAQLVARDCLLSEMKVMKEKLEQQEQSIRNIQQYKYLITSSGALLEKSVKMVLSNLGFSILEAEDRRSDIIAKYGDTNIVAEIKGVSKSAAEKHAAQLEKWVSQFLEETGSCAKPILIVNGYCALPLDERIESVFPDQMIKYSTLREHALVTTTQLLCLYIEVQNHPECKEERIQELLSTIGIYSRYTNPFEFIERRIGENYA